ncbi:MAG: exodeoxyribonuclease VII small subunit [Defluviitaleaceae bacterium]|nr:exodeoxyribonuclease VII small subunit [Defluviitaleaceae bacterium]
MPKARSFEESIKRLEEIAEIMESGDTSLETSMALYREGIKLTKDCAAQLSKCENEIMVLQKESDDVFALKIFNGQDTDS